MSEETIRSLSVNGVPYAYRVLRQPDGITEPVLVLGGALQGMSDWQQMEMRLRPVASVITADLPGMGSAAALPPGPGVDLLCAAVERIINDLDVPRINLFGFSYGAGIAFGCARRFPRRIARLALGGTPVHIGAAQTERWQRAREELSRGAVDRFASLIADGLLCPDEQRFITRRRLAHRYVQRAVLHAARHAPHAVDSLLRAPANRPDFSGGLAGVPTLVFSGAHDTVTSPARQRRFACTLSEGRFLTIPDTDHWVVLERPQAVADLTARFFTDGPLSSAPGLAPATREEEPADGTAYA
ncbi:alpha/beta fold hydrolase [Streptomyces sp. NPDC048644]|uniref:alpha/beta fold hydrolase n=1 Tax=Streptomyces sp. NPDC048644 TaxID=3365582 RepID=UPI00370FB19D